MAKKPTYKQTHVRIGAIGVQPVTVEGTVFVDGRRRWVPVETRQGTVELWIDVDHLLRQFAGRAMRSSSGVKKLAKGAIQLRSTRVQRTAVTP